MKLKIFFTLASLLLTIAFFFVVNRTNVHSQSPTPTPQPSPSTPQSAGFCDNNDRPFGDVQVMNIVPPPGYPEGVIVSDDHKRIYVAAGVNPESTEGQDVPAPSQEQSVIYEYDRCTGALLRGIPILGQAPVNPRAISHLTFDNKNRLYVLEFQRGIIRINLDSGTQELYAVKAPDLKPCGGSGQTGLPCSPTTTDQRPVMNESVFDSDGYLYFTDSFQATIFRVPPTGPLPRTPEIWFQSRAFDAQGGFGLNGIAIDKGRQLIYVNVTSDSSFSKAGVYTIPLVDHPLESDLRLFHLYSNARGDTPDGMAFSSTGNLYVNFATPGPPTGDGGGVSVLNECGEEVALIKNPQIFDSPACVAFDQKGNLLVTNHSFFNGNRAKMQLLNVFVDENGQNLYEPNVDRNGNLNNNSNTPGRNPVPPQCRNTTPSPTPSPRPTP